MLKRSCAVGLLGIIPILGGWYSCSVLAGEVSKPIKQAAFGANLRMATAEEVKRYSLTQLKGRPNGLYLTATEKDGPAEKAGLKRGDVLLALDDNKMFSRDDFDDFLRVSNPKSKVSALVKRADTFQEGRVTVTLGASDKIASDSKFTWQYAGLAQLEKASAAAKKKNRLVLVGLSGADT